MTMNLENIRPPKIEDFPGMSVSGFRFLNEVAKWINNNAGLVVREDVALGDFVFSDFTRDGTWRTLDLSSIIPEQSRAVFVHTKIMSVTTVGHRFSLRKYNNTNRQFDTITHVVDINHYQSGLVEVSRSRKIDYWATNTSDWSDIELTIMAWAI